MNRRVEGPEPQPNGSGLFRWQILAAGMGALLLFLAFQLWRRLENVDPRQRCAGAYQNVHTAVDTSLVDRITVRWPDRDSRSTCGELRSSGELSRLPRSGGTGGLLPPRPQP